MSSVVMQASVQDRHTDHGEKHDMGAWIHRQLKAVMKSVLEYSALKQFASNVNSLAVDCCST
jgi:hypothetical protein